MNSYNEHVTALFILATYYWLMDRELDASKMVEVAVDVLQHPAADA